MARDFMNALADQVAEQSCQVSQRCRRSSWSCVGTLQNVCPSCALDLESDFRRARAAADAKAKPLSALASNGAGTPGIIVTGSID